MSQQWSPINQKKELSYKKNLSSSPIRKVTVSILSILKNYIERKAGEENTSPVGNPKQLYKRRKSLLKKNENCNKKNFPRIKNFNRKQKKKKIFIDF